MANVLYKSDDGIPDEIKQSPYYRKSRFDWLFGEGYRRPLAADQGGKMRRGWLAYGFHPTDEYTDWKRAHAVFFALIGIAFPGLVFVLWYKPDWPLMREWAFREAVLELERRERAGLEPISKDLINPEKIKMEKTDASLSPSLSLSCFRMQSQNAGISFYYVVKFRRIIIKCGFCQA
ncbi:NADH dehydrogenase [ubiquinone] 1 beta subcomplex subunit [Trichinella pseudospiralis]